MVHIRKPPNVNHTYPYYSKQKKNIIMQVMALKSCHAPESHEEDECDQQGSQRDAVAQVVDDDCYVVMQLALLLLIENFLALRVVPFLSPGAIGETFSVHIIGGVVSDPKEGFGTGPGHHLSSTAPGPACSNAINGSVTE